MADLLTIQVPADTAFAVRADPEWAGRYFANLCADEQAAVFAAMVRHMAPFALQWDYVAIDIGKLPNAREIRNILTMLGTEV